MTDDQRIAHFSAQLHGWLAEVPPWPTAAAEAAAQLAHDLNAALNTAEAALADVLAEGQTSADAITGSLTTVVTRLTACSAALLTEVDRVTDLLDHLPETHNAARQFAGDLKTMAIDMEHALDGCAATARNAGQALLNASTHAHVMLDQGWKNLVQALETLNTAIVDAAADATHQIDVSLPAWGRAVDDLGQGITDRLAATLHIEMEQGMVRELGTLRAEIERRIDEAVAALTTAVRSCGDDVAKAPSLDVSRIVQEIQDILQLGPQVVADATMVPMKVTELLLRRATGGLF